MHQQMIKIYQERTDTTKRKTSFAFFKTHHDAYLQSHQPTCPLDWMVARMSRDVPSSFWHVRPSLLVCAFLFSFRIGRNSMPTGLQTQISTLTTSKNIATICHNMWKPRKHR